MSDPSSCLLWRKHQWVLEACIMPATPVTVWLMPECGLQFQVHLFIELTLNKCKGGVDNKPVSNYRSMCVGESAAGLYSDPLAAMEPNIMGWIQLVVDIFEHIYCHQGEGNISTNMLSRNYSTRCCWQHDLWNEIFSSKQVMLFSYLKSALSGYCKKLFWKLTNHASCNF